MISPGGTRNKSSPIFLLCCAADKWLIRKVKKLAHAPAAAWDLLKGSKKHTTRPASLSARCYGFSRKEIECADCDIPWRAQLLGASNGKNIECRLTAQIPCARTNASDNFTHAFTFSNGALCVLTERLARLVPAGFYIIVLESHTSSAQVCALKAIIIVCSASRPTGGCCGSLAFRMDTIVNCAQQPGHTKYCDF